MTGADRQTGENRPDIADAGSPLLGVDTCPAYRRKVGAYRALKLRCRNVSLSRKALRCSQGPHVLTRVGVQVPGQVRTAAQRDAPVCRGAVNHQTNMS